MARPKSADPSIHRGLTIHKSLDERIRELARKADVSVNKWINRVLTREAFKHKKGKGCSYGGGR